MSYMVEGQGSKSFTHAKRLLVEEPDAGPRAARPAGTGGGRVPRRAGRGGRAGGAAVRFLGQRARARGTSGSSRCPTWPRRRGSPRAAGAPVIVFAPGAGLGPRGDRRRHRRRRDRRGLADGRGRCAPAARRRSGRASGESRPVLALRAAGGDPRAHAPTCWPRSAAEGHIANLGHGIHPGRAGGPCPGVRRRGQGVAGAVSGAPCSASGWRRRWSGCTTTTTAFFTRLDGGGALSGGPLGAGREAAAASPACSPRARPSRRPGSTAPR